MNEQEHSLPAVSIRGMSKWFGDFQALKDIDLTVQYGERVVICGPSGSGKLSNEQMGQLFGLSCSAISHAVKTLKARMQDNSELMRKLKQLNSQFKL